MDRKETVSYCLDSLKKAGADKASCALNISEKKSGESPQNDFLNRVLVNPSYPKRAA